MQIRHATEQDQPAWDAYVQKHPDGLAYQLFAWQQAVTVAYGFKSRSVLAQKSGRICGVLPLISFKVPLFSSALISLPYCDAGGILADSSKIATQVLNFAREEALRSGCGCEIRSTVELLVKAENQTDKVRMLLDLPESSDLLLSDLKAKLRSQVKKPLRDGLVAKIGGGELVKDFYPIFARNMRDLGSPVHSRRWINAVVATYGNNCRVAVIYTPDGVAAAAGIILLHRKTVSIPWASAVREYNRLNPNMLLYWTFLSFAADNGYRQFDFGRSTPDEGTYRFKQQWGAIPQPLYWYDLQTSVVKCREENASGSLLSRKRQLITGAWKKLPLSAANMLGPAVRRYLSL